MNIKDLIKIRKELFGDIRLIKEEEYNIKIEKEEIIDEFNSLELQDEMKNILKALNIKTEEELILNIMVMTSIMTIKKFNGSFIGTIAGEIVGTNFLFSIGPGAKEIIDMSEKINKIRESIKNKNID